MDGLLIGEVAGQGGVSVRALRYYEEVGLLNPSRDASGRRYDAHTIDRLTRIRLQRQLDVPLAEIDPETDQLLGPTRRHLVEIDGQLADLARRRERVRGINPRPLVVHAESRGTHPR